MVLCPVVNSLRMLELLGQVCLVVVRTALLNLACWVELSNMDWSVGLTVCFWSHRSRLVCSGPSCSLQFGLVCSGWFVLLWYLWYVLLWSFLACALLAGSGLVWFLAGPLLCWIRSFLICSALL